MVYAHRGEAIERNIRGRTLPQLVEIAIEIEMLGINIGDYGDGRWQPVEAAVAFVRFDNHPVTGTEPRVGAIGIDNAAIDPVGYHGTIQYGGDQRVVVVLPWVPAQAMDHFNRISSPSISERCTTGNMRARAAKSSGCPA